MSSVLTVRKSAVPSLPENVRAYVQEFFREREVLGIQCMVAARYVHHPSGTSYGVWKNGVAPAHSVDLMRFGKSERGKEVGEEIREALKERPDDLFEAFVEEPHYSSINCD